MINRIIIIIIIIIFATIIITTFNKNNNKIEPFQYILVGRTFKPYEYAPVKKKNKIPTIQTPDSFVCGYLCSTTPGCTGYNYFLNECTMYRQKEYHPYKSYYRYW